MHVTGIDRPFRPGRWARQFAALILAVVGMFFLTGCPPKELGGFAPPPDTEKLRRPPSEQVQPLDPALAQAAKDELAKDLADSTPTLEAQLLRARAIEAERETLGSAARADYLRALNDPKPIVRFAAAMAVGQLKIAEAKEALLRLLQDENPKVRIAVRFALHRLGDFRYSHDLEKFAADPDPLVRGQTAAVLGLLGDPSASKILRVMRGDPSPAVREQASTSLWQLGDQVGLSDLAGLVSSHLRDDQIMGMLGLASTRSESVRQLIRPELSRESAPDTDVRLVAAWAFGMIGGAPYDIGFPIAVDGAKSGDPKLRILAARALGAIGRTDEQPLLRDMLKDSDPEVRIAAAAAILQLTPPEKRPRGTNDQGLWG